LRTGLVSCVLVGDVCSTWVIILLRVYTGTIQCVWEKGEAYAQEGNAAAEFEQVKYLACKTNKNK